MLVNVSCRVNVRGGIPTRTATLASHNVTIAWAKSAATGTTFCYLILAYSRRRILSVKKLATPEATKSRRKAASS